MPKISERGISMPESPIRKLVPYAEAAKKKGNKVYHLNIGQPDIKTPEKALDAVRNLSDKVIEYSHSAGNEGYRRKLSAFYANYGINISHEEMLVTTGGSEAVIFAFLSCMNPGDEVIIPEPFYTNYNGFAAMAGVKVIAVTSKIEDGFALPPISEFEKLVGPRTKGIMLCNPNNPTGYLYSKSEMEQLRDMVKKHDLYLFSDEVYREFCYDDSEYISAMTLEGIEQNVIFIDSISKRYSACGIRIGLMASKNKAVIAASLKFGQARLSPPALGQIAGEAAIETEHEYFDEVYAEYIERRDCVIDGLNKIPGVYAPTPKGAFYTIVKLPIDDCERFCQWILSDFSYNAQTVMLAPASGFYATPGLGKNEVRIAYVLKKEDLVNAIEVLAEALKVYPGRTL